MSYALRKTPRSSFMIAPMGEATAVAETPGIMSPPFVQPTVALPPVSTPEASSGLGLGRYVLWGGLAYLAYLLWKE